jgi:phosphoribosylformimino-5-aminoimidazole carboxamide ribotide isomerase
VEIVPVIDLKDGVVVRARHGDRASYRPIHTPLSLSPAPLEVVKGLMSLHPFRTLYIADLDAIEGKSDGAAVISEITASFPGLDLWIDNGCADRSAAEALLAEMSSTSLVLGSESQRDASLVRALRESGRILLSLDFRGDRLLGPEALLAEPDLWPERVIVMTLARVGSSAGPDFARFDDMRRRSPTRRYYMAGGLRDHADLAAAEQAGAAGFLVASALHDGRLTGDDLAELEETARRCSHP